MFILSPVTGIFIDRVSNRKWPLVLGLVVQAIATVLTASATNGKISARPMRLTPCSKVSDSFSAVYSLCFSKVFQGAGATLLWIAAMATITDNVGSANMGKIMGIIGPIISTGAFFGPVISGLLFSAVGYWRAWIVPVAMISLDLTLRLAMVDTPPSSDGKDVVASKKAESETGPRGADLEEQAGSSSAGETPVTLPQSFSIPPLATSSTLDEAHAPSVKSVEATPLLAGSAHEQPSLPPFEPLTNAACFLYILRQRRIISSFLITVILSIIFNSFGATLALHVQDVFDWGPRQVGFLFLALVGPSVLLGPFTGWLRDLIGIRWPTMVGTGLATFLFILIGHVGDETLDWMQGDVGKKICVGTLLLMGVAMELTEGICTIEGTGMLIISQNLEQPILSLILTAYLAVIDELEARKPGIFGPQGGYSRLFSLTSMLFSLGSLLGPLLSGGLTVRFDYMSMNYVLGENIPDIAPSQRYKQPMLT